MREHTSRVGGSNMARLDQTGAHAVGKHTRVEDAFAAAAPPTSRERDKEEDDDGDLDGAEHEDAERELAWVPRDGARPEGGTQRRRRKRQPSFGEVLAKVGEQVLKQIGALFESYADGLSRYSEEGANLARQALERTRATCGPGSIHIERQVQLEADRLTSFYFARLVREIGVQARGMAGACNDLREKLHARDPDALSDFIRAILGSSGALLNEFDAFSRDVSEVDEIVRDIGARCGRPVELEVPKALKPFVIPETKLELRFNPRLVPFGPVVTLDGLEITGGFKVVPRGLGIKRGPVVTDYSA